MPWRGPLGGDPLETLPGPANPWFSCSGADNARPAEAGVDTPELPDFALSKEGAIAIDWKKIGVGHSMVTSGVSVIAVGIVGAVAVAANLPATAAGTAANASTSTIGAILAAGGSVLIGAGLATMIGGIDPKISDYKKHVPAVPTRKLALPGDLPAPVTSFMQAVAEIERLSTAETDIIDHARAAAKAKDKSWTELHLRDLYHVQNAKQHFVGELAGSLNEINAAFGKEFDHHRVDPDEPVRDLVNPLIEMRSTLNEVAGLSSTEINNILATVRVPSPMSEAIDTSIQRIATKAEGQPSEMVNIAVQQLANLDVIDHEAFGLKD
ncbi:hypothetical protein EH31_05820 [Erythrobacter longus]|uniref:Uncharacterized protein n=1 Tax=Erythrobacter longus TaxID=1044 RepID=A0A074MK04_ERYLO|nr:hypothetical protein [Erythrobacter longus]KEO92183.1 hypothetical protein EH31_05820 [Erythrobacter longus]